MSPTSLLASDMIRQAKNYSLSEILSSPDEEAHVRRTGHRPYRLSWIGVG